MDPWTVGLVALLVLGFLVILYGALHDRARNRRARAEMLSPPDRAIPRFAPDSPAPQYLSELQARRPPAAAATLALSDGERESVKLQLQASGTTSYPVGYATPAFVTDPATSWAVLDDAAVLVCAEPVDSVRELLPAMERCLLAARPLVIVAPALGSDVLATLEVNAIQQKLRLVAVTPRDHQVLTAIAAQTGATATERGDRQAGYVTAEQLGHVGRWVSDRSRSYVVASVPSAAPRE